ncbi:MAG: MlaD family protein, partial [Bacteroidales bacterium]
LYAGIEFLKGVNLFKPANFYYVKYENVSGLSTSAPIKLNGFNVGVVREITYLYEEDGQILVEMSLDKRLQIPVDSKAELVTDMLGTASIDLILSDNSEYYEVGASLVSSSSVGLMESLSNEILPNVNGMMVIMDSILTSVNTLMANPALNESITRLDAISKNVEETTNLLNNVMNENLVSTANEINEIAANLKVITENLSVVSCEVSQMPLDSTMNNVNQISENLRLTTEQLNKSTSTLGLLLNDRAMYDNLNSTIVSLDSIIVDLKNHPSKYVNFKLF